MYIINAQNRLHMEACVAMKNFVFIALLKPFLSPPPGGIQSSLLQTLKACKSTKQSTHTSFTRMHKTSADKIKAIQEHQNGNKSKRQPSWQASDAGEDTFVFSCLWETGNPCLISTSRECYLEGEAAEKAPCCASTSRVSKRSSTCRRSPCCLQGLCHAIKGKAVLQVPCGPR